MTVVVTGASGHIGLNLVRALVAEKRSVRAVVHHNHQVLDGLGVEIVTGDVTDMASLTRALEGADVVYHLAGVISLLRNEWPLVEKINIQGTRNVIEACRSRRRGAGLATTSPFLGRPRLRFGAAGTAGTARTGFSRAAMAVASRAM